MLIRPSHVDGENLKVDLTMAKALGGPGDAGKTNPEELFAAGYGACCTSPSPLNPIPTLSNTQTNSPSPIRHERRRPLPWHKDAIHPRRLDRRIHRRTRRQHERPRHGTARPASRQGTRAGEGGSGEGGVQGEAGLPV